MPEPLGSYGFTLNDKYFKQDYFPASDNLFATSTELLSQIEIRSDLTGTKSIIAVPTGPDGGFGGLNSSYYPEASSDSAEQIEITSKPIFHTSRVELKAIKASQSRRGSYWPVMTRAVQNAVKTTGFMTDLVMFVGSNARVGQCAAASAYVSGGATSPVIEFASGSFNHRRFYKNMLLEFGNSGDTAVEDGVFKVVSVSRSTRRVTFSRVKGTFDPSGGVNSRYMYIQNMFKNAPTGLEDVVEATSGTLYTLAYDEQYWAPLKIDAGNRPFSVELLNYVYAEQYSRVDKEFAPNLVVVNYDLWAQIATDRENFKTIQLKPRGNGKPAVETGYSAIQHVTSEGKTVDIVGAKHMAPRKMYLLNTSQIVQHRLPDFGWVNDDGIVYLRTPRQPYIEAQYGGWIENFINPTFQCFVDNVDHKEIADF